MKRKKIINLFLSFILVIGSAFVSTACNNSEDDKESQGEQESKEKELCTKFNVTFDGKGGTLTNGNATQSVCKASEIETPTYTKYGYVFDGWNTTLSEITEATTVEAKWKAMLDLDDYEVKTIANNKVLYAVVDYDTNSINFLDKFKAESNNGWKVYSDLEGTNQIATKNSTLVEGDNQFYIMVDYGNGKEEFYNVVINRKQYITINFKNGETLVDSIKIKNGETLNSHISEIPSVEESGYTFVKWDYEYEKKIRYEDATNFTINIDAILTTTINFNYNGELVYSTKTISDPAMFEVDDNSWKSCNTLWSDGTNVYYSCDEKQYILDKSLSTFVTKTWHGLTEFRSYDIWSDGENIYYSYKDKQYVLDKTTSTWSEKTWAGLTNFYAWYVWSDGENVYYSNGSEQYVLDKSTSTWTEKTWNGLTNFSVDYIWTDGTDIYYSKNEEQYVLNKLTSTWDEKTWAGLNSFHANDIITIGTYVYCSQYDYMLSKSSYYVLDKVTSSWKESNLVAAALKRIKVYGINDGDYTYNYFYDFSEVILKDKSSKDVVKGKNVTIPVVLSRDKGEVKEWNTKADGAGTKYTPGEIISYDFEGEITLYAIWED